MLCPARRIQQFRRVPDSAQTADGFRWEPAWPTPNKSSPSIPREFVTVPCLLADRVNLRCLQVRVSHGEAFCGSTSGQDRTKMTLKKISSETLACTTSPARPFGCMELWAGNERAHRSLELAGLEADVIAVPSGGDKGGDLSAVFSCSDNTARVVLADCVGHGYTASGVARHVHHLLHKFQDIRDTAGLLAALNDAFTLSNEQSDDPLRLTTVVTGTFDGTSGEFNFAYAAHPRMLLWRGHERRFLELGEGLEGFPLGYSTGETYSQQSVRLNHGDLILAFSDGATEVRSPVGEQLTSKGFLGLAERTLGTLPHPLVLRDFSRK